jgi:hypothetical protein
VAGTLEKWKMCEELAVNLHQWVDESQIKLLGANSNTGQDKNILRSKKTELDKINNVALRRLEVRKPQQ